MLQTIGKIKSNTSVSELKGDIAGLKSNSLYTNDHLGILSHIEELALGGGLSVSDLNNIVIPVLHKEIKKTRAGWESANSDDVYVHNKAQLVLKTVQRIIAGKHINTGILRLHYGIETILRSTGHSMDEGDALSNGIRELALGGGISTRDLNEIHSDYNR